MKLPIAALLFAFVAACAPSEAPGGFEETLLNAASHVTNAADPEDVQQPGDARDIPTAVILDPLRDPTHPARNRQLVIPSGPVRPELGRPAEMNALFLLAAGEGPKPTLLLLHGLPGNERNLDLAQAARRAGWNVLAFTYRGAWGSEGTFSIHHAIDDSWAALEFLRSDATIRDYGVDSERIVVAGHSMGGMAAVLVAERDRLSARPRAGSLAGLVLIDAWNAGATAREVRAAGAPGRAALVASFDDIGRAFGPITADDLADNLLARGESWELRARAATLARLPVLSVWASRGLAAQNRALAEAIRGRDGARLSAVELDSDHAFADSRIALAAELVNWLGTIAPPR